MRIATMAFAGALALTSSISLAQAAGPGGGAAGSAGAASTGGGSSTSVPAGNPPGATTGQARPGAMGDPSGAAANPSGNSLINTSPSGSTLDQTGTGTNHRR